MSGIEKAVRRSAGETTESAGATVAGQTKEDDNKGGDSQTMLDKTTRQLPKKLKTVCPIDFAALKQEGFLSPSDRRSRQAEEYRTIKRPLLNNAFGKEASLVEHGNLIMVTSAMPAEGKTFTSINLAISMAMEQDFTVLLVDCDDLRCSTSRLLEVDDSIGLVDVLQDPELDLSDAILSTSLPRLRVLPAGRSLGHTPELLASERMQRLINELSERYADRVIIFDTPPLLATSQAAVLAQLMGQILVVVEAGKTPLQAVQDAIAQIDQNKAVGMVLNKSPEVFKSDYYGGYYGRYE
ncbi:MAG TPA: tyrosine-protein kinase family protein, partial [Gammaproteobacteria bacterium]|nr:tyrosine-protein kinase family protein [Gammaproteobacteria bacterium]